MCVCVFAGVGYVSSSMCHNGVTVSAFAKCCVVVDILGGKKKEVKKETGLGLSVTKDENFGEWYSEVYFVTILQ